MFDCFGEVHRHHVGQFYLLSQGKAGMPCREILAVRRMLLDQHRTSTANCRPLVPVVARLSECTVISRKQSMKTAAGPSNNPQLWMCKRRRKLSPSLSRTFFRDHLRETLRGWRTPSSRCFLQKKRVLLDLEAFCFKRNMVRFMHHDIPNPAENYTSLDLDHVRCLPAPHRFTQVLQPHFTDSHTLSKAATVQKERLHTNQTTVLYINCT